jgi:hypothetical protein
MDAITQARADAEIALGARYDFFFLRYRGNGELDADQEPIYKEAFNTALQEIEDKRWGPASKVDEAMDRTALLQELEQDKEKYKDGEKHLREPMGRLVRVVMHHLVNRGNLLDQGVFFIEERRDGKVVLSNRGNLRFFAPEWLAELYKKAAMQLITLRVSYKVGEIVKYESRKYRVIETGHISVTDAADLEDGFDIFDAAGPYSKLELIKEEKETLNIPENQQPSQKAMQCINEMVGRGEATISQEDGAYIVKFSAPDGNEAVPLLSLEYNDKIGLYDKRQFLDVARSQDALENAIKTGLFNMAYLELPDGKSIVVGERSTSGVPYRHATVYAKSSGVPKELESDVFHIYPDPVEEDDIFFAYDVEQEKARYHRFLAKCVGANYSVRAWQSWRQPSLENPDLA